MFLTFLFMLVFVLGREHITNPKVKHKPPKPEQGLMSKMCDIERCLTSRPFLFTVHFSSLVCWTCNGFIVEIKTSLHTLDASGTYCHPSVTFQ